MDIAIPNRYALATGQPLSEEKANFVTHGAGLALSIVGMLRHQVDEIDEITLPEDLQSTRVRFSGREHPRILRSQRQETTCCTIVRGRSFATHGTAALIARSRAVTYARTSFGPAAPLVSHDRECSFQRLSNTVSKAPIAFTIVGPCVLIVVN